MNDLSLMNFNYKKATQCLNYFARKSSNNSVNKMKAIKLIWAADRYHLRKYGRPITWDAYFALKLGPIGSTTLDIADDAQHLDPDIKVYANQFIKPLNKNTYTSKKALDLDVFSETDIEALNFAFENFNKYDKYVLAKEITHKYPEWAKHKKHIEELGIPQCTIDYNDFFENPQQAKLDDPFSLSKGDILASQQMFEEKKRSSLAGV